MELGILDRLVLLQVVPKQGDITTIKLVQDFISECGFSEEELEEYKIGETAQGGAKWDDPEDNPYTKDVSIGDRLFRMIKKEFQNLNKKKQLQLSHIKVYDKFIPPKVEDKPKLVKEATG